MLLLLVLGMLEVLVVLVVLVVLKELAVFVRGKFETVKPQNFFWGKIIESKKKVFGLKTNLKILKTKVKNPPLFLSPFQLTPSSSGLGLTLFGRYMNLKMSQSD